MKRLLARIRMNRALDDGRDALAGLTEPSLREEARGQQELIDRLRADAPQWVRRNQAQTTLPSPSGQRWSAPGQLLPVAVALAACALVSTSLLAPTGHSGFGEGLDSNDPTIELSDLQGAFERGQRTAAKLEAGVDSLAQSVRQPSQIGDLTTHYVERAGSVFGQGLALLGRAQTP